MAGALQTSGRASRPAAASPPSYGVRTERTWIPMEDGVRLAATLFHPDGAQLGERFPPLLEYLPYRKDDWFYRRDRDIHPYFARRGYVGVRVDLRGTGSSEGTLPDREYSEVEHADGLRIIDWLCRQPWSNGNVGMFGISWGGFNAIQVAMLRPKALKAILAIEATDDLFHDDIHYVDGMMHVDEYELAMDLDNGMTASPEFPVDEASLAARFDRPPWKLLWLQHQRDGPFWRRGSLIGRYEAIRIPAFLIGGWLDGYRDSVPRMLEHLRGPVKAIVGPWNHSCPHDAVPGPAIEWRHEAVRWWDEWLKGRDTGVLEEPSLAVYVRRSHPPGPGLATIPGAWRFEDGWPIARIRLQELFLTPDHALSRVASTQDVHELPYVPSAGPEAGFWWGDLTVDQGPLDGQSLVYDSSPLERDLEILGMPEVVLRASARAPLAHWFVRLCDVAPDRRSTLVTGSGINGAHRASATRPEAMRPGRVHSFRLEMHFTSWVFPKGHRIRLGVSNALWPMIWPTPHPTSSSLHVGGSRASRLVLPRIPRGGRGRPRFLPPEPGDPVTEVRTRGDAWPGRHRVTRDEARKASIVEWHGTSATDFSWGAMEHEEKIVYEVEDAHPEAASVSSVMRTTVRRPTGVLEWRGIFDLRSDARTFHYRYTRELWKDGSRLRVKTWDEGIPRDFQ